MDLLFIIIIISNTPGKNQLLVRKEPVAAENRIAPLSQTRIISKIPASKIGQGPPYTALAVRSQSSVPIQN